MSKTGKVGKYLDDNRKERWRFDLDVGPNRRDRKRIIRRGFATRGAAQEALNAERTRWADVRNPSSLSFGDYFSDWIDRREANGIIRPSTALGYRAKLGLVPDWLAGTKLARLEASDLDRFYRQLLTTGGRTGQGRSASTVRQVHRIIRTALGDAVRKGLVGRNESDAADPPSARSAKPKERRVWNADEARAFLAADWIPHYRRVLWATAFGTGMRRGELAGLYWSDLDGDALSVRRSRNTIGGTILEGSPKSDRGLRTVPIDATLAGLLRDWWIEQGNLLARADLGPQYVFTNSVLAPWDPDGITRFWREDATRAVTEGLVSRYMRLHDARHWYATQLVAAGTDLNTVADQLGHSSPAFTLAVYGHSDSTRARAAADAVGAVLWG